MNYQYTPYALVFAASSLMTVALAAFAFRRREMPGASPFAIAMLMVTGWLLTSALQMSSGDVPTLNFWSGARYLAYVGLPVAILAAVSQYWGDGQWLTQRRLALLSIVPFFTVVLAWTNESHGLMGRSAYVETAGSFVLVARTYGPWSWIQLAYFYLLFLATVLMIVQLLRRTPAAYRGQPLTMLAALLLPGVMSVAYGLGLWQIRSVDITPIVFALMGLVLAWGIFRYRLLDIGPVARDKVVDGMGIGMVVLNTMSQILDLNPAAQRILGCSRSGAIGQQTGKLFNAWPELVELCHGSVAAKQEIVCGTDDVRRYYEVQSSPLTDQRGHPIGRLISLHDITERRQVDDALRESEQKYRELVDLLPETIYEADLTGRLTYLNGTATEQFGYTQDDVERGLHIPHLLVPEDRERGMRNIGAILSGIPLQVGEYTVFKKNGTTIPAVIAASRIMREGQPIGVRGFLVDISERKRAQAKLSEQQQTLAVMMERERLARELHDSLGQVLGFANTQAQAARELLAKGQTDRADTYLARLASVVQDAQADIREYILGVKVLISADAGFLSAIEEYLQRFSVLYELPTELVILGDRAGITLAPAAEVQLLRIIQEALTNVRKHANARHVRVVFSTDGGQIEATIEDDGVGFDYEQSSIASRETFGFRSMMERARGVLGTLEVRPTRGQGTKVIVRIPLAGEERSMEGESIVGG